MRRHFRDGDRVVLTLNEEARRWFGWGQRAHIGLVLTYRMHHVVAGLSNGEATLRHIDDRFISYRVEEAPHGDLAWPLSAVRLSASTPEGRQERLARIEALCGKLAGRVGRELNADRSRGLVRHDTISYLHRLSSLAARVHRAQAIVAAERAS